MQGADPDADRPVFEAMLESAFEAGTVIDAAIAQSQRENVQTAQDILEGRMNVEIGMAAVRPAEFIVLRCAFEMQAG